MNKEIITFQQTSPNLFNNDKVTVVWYVNDYPKLAGRVETANPDHTKAWATRHTITTILTQMFKGRKSALEIQGYGSERHLMAIDRLNMAIKTLANITDHYYFLSYVNTVIIPDMWKLCPGPASPFKNYKPKLEQISSFIKSEMLKNTPKNCKKSELLSG